MYYGGRVVSRVVATSFALGIVVTAVTCAAGQPGIGDDARTLTEAYNRSGQDLFASFASFAASPGNIVFSPYSIGTVMAMTYSGARGDTAAQMANALKQRMGRREIDAANGEVMAILTAYDHGADPWTCPRGMTLKERQCEMRLSGDRRLCGLGLRLEGEHCVATATPPRSARLLAANGLALMQRGGVISGDYASLLHTRYAAEVFKGAGVEDINGWVSRKTEGKVGKILDELDPNAVAVLINAVYFKARWESPFDAKTTRDDAFNLSPSQSVQVPTMSRTGNYALVARAGYRAIRLPYEIPALGMVVVVPNDIDGLPAVARGLDMTELTTLLAALRDSKASKSVAVALPRFRADFKADLVSPFRQSGMKDAFDATRADFSGMSGVSPSEAQLYLSQIVHRAVIEVAEESTEASAATAAVISVRSAAARRPEPENFRVDRPFLFYLVDDATGSILFEGRIADPR